MGNRGSITIFCCLMIIAMVVLGISSIQVVEYHLAKAKGAIVVESAMSGVKAGYNSYIFENYHILLFDKNSNGKGEAYLEEQLSSDIEHNLGDGFGVEQLSVNDYDLILEDDIRAFKSQVSDYVGYGLIKSGAEAILESTGGEDGTLSDYIYQDMEEAENSSLSYDEPSQSKPSTEGNKDASEGQLPSLGDTEDPREYTDNLTSDGILYLVAPEDLHISSQIIDLSSTPSLKGEIMEWFDYEIDTDFEDMDIFKEDVSTFDSWKEELIDGGAGIAYAGNVFNCATEMIQEETVFEFELEYLICGKASDRENLKGTVNRIIGIRLPVNYSYLLTDAKRMAEVKKLSLPIALATLVPEPVVRYLIAGCWAFVESIFDVRCLLDGQRMDFFKTDSTWKTDINNLENSKNLEGDDTETGLCYKDYLLILLALNLDGGYYRMLDIIELNTKQYYEDFDMDNAAVGFSLDAHISYQGKDYYYREAIGY